MEDGFKGDKTDIYEEFRNRSREPCHSHSEMNVEKLEWRKQSWKNGEKDSNRRWGERKKKSTEIKWKRRWKEDPPGRQKGRWTGLE